MSRSCRPALVADERVVWLADDLGVKNLLKRFGVMGGGLFGLEILRDRGDLQRSFPVPVGGDVMIAESGPFLDFHGSLSNLRY